MLPTSLKRHGTFILCSSPTIHQQYTNNTQPKAKYSHQQQACTSPIVGPDPQQAQIQRLISVSISASPSATNSVKASQHLFLLQSSSHQLAVQWVRRRIAPRRLPTRRINKAKSPVVGHVPQRTHCNVVSIALAPWLVAVVQHIDRLIRDRDRKCTRCIVQDIDDGRVDCENVSTWHFRRSHLTDKARQSLPRVAPTKRLHPGRMPVNGINGEIKASTGLPVAVTSAVLFQYYMYSF